VALLVGFIGCALHWDLKFAKKKEDTFLTTENIIEMLKKHDVTQFEVNGESVLFRTEGYLLVLDYESQPMVKLTSIFSLEDEINLEAVKKAADEFNKDYLNATVQIGDDRVFCVTCMTFAENTDVLFDALPLMKQYLDMARYKYFLKAQKNDSH
jgi:hypothetical protein